ncbi:phosphoinositide phosphatase SAC6-like protein [Tanacetum coccineum]
MSQEKDDQKKFHKIREDKELEKVIALENKIKVLDDIVYKTGQSVQTMNMLNRNCKTSFVKPKFLKKAQRENPRLTVAAESTNQKLRSTIRKQDKQISKTCTWWYCKITPPGYKWKPKSRTFIEIILFVIDSGFSKHMMRNLKLLSNFLEKFMGMMKFGNDQIAPILGYGDLVQGNITIKRVYYVKGLNHNLFFVGQFYDADLEVAFRKSTCYIRDLKGNDLLIAKATPSQAWLWHHRLSHLKFDFINLLSKNDITQFLRSKDETPEVLIDFLKLVQRGLHAQVRTVQIDKGMKLLNKTLHAYFAQEGIKHQTSTARTPEQNGIAEAIAIACFTQNRSLVFPRHKKTPYHIINGRKQSVKFFYIFGSLCYIVRDGENLNKMKEKAETVTTSNKLDLLFSLMFDELLNGTTQVVSKSFAVTTADAPNQRQQKNTTSSTSATVAADIPPLNIQTTPETTSQAPTQAPTITSNMNIIQAKTNKEYAQVNEDEFINIFSTPVQEQGETSFQYVDSSNMHTFYQ